MGLARDLLLRASRSAWLSRQMSQRSFSRRAVRRFMPGEDVEDALAAARALETEKLGSVLTQLGENLTDLREADAVREHYLGVFQTIRARRLPAQVSVKPTQLGLDLSGDACRANLELLAGAAEAAGSFLWIDMEDSSYVDRTLDLYRRLRERHQPVGVCVQAYLRRTPADLESLLAGRAAIRLVKGAYAEAPALAFPSRRDVDEAFARLGARLLQAAAAGTALPVFGTHDQRLLARLGEEAGRLGVGNGAWEIHMLYGIRSAEQRALASSGRTVRTLISYGEHWFPWYMRRLAERPANVWFVVRSVVAG